MKFNIEKFQYKHKEVNQVFHYLVLKGIHFEGLILKRLTKMLFKRT